MSQVYNLEPPTKGQVVLHTSHGDIEIELWPKEAPKAVRNFAQLCMEGYYDNTIFHRIIKDFLIQGGDPTGTGSGGESVFGRPFKTTSHSRLKFNHRGIVACANVPGQLDSNTSQFFITTERCDNLDRQNTIFGRVSGETIFTVLRLQEVEVDDADRPVDPPIITSCEVVMPPFDDIVPRTTPAEKQAIAAAEAEKKRLADLQQRKMHGRRLNVLSFGDEAEEDDAADVRFRSAHETLQGDAALQQEEVGVHDEHVTQLQLRLAEEKRAQAHLDELAAKEEVVSGERDSDEEDRADAFADAMRAKVKAKASSRTAAHRGNGETEPPRGVEKDGNSRMTSGDAGIDEEKKKRTKAVGASALREYNATADALHRHKRSREDQAQESSSNLRQFRSKLQAAAKTHKTSGQEVAPGGTSSGDAEGKAEAYDGKVNKDIDHRVYMPAAWRIDQYLEDSDADEDIQTLAGHRMVWDDNDRVADPTARRDDVDDYKVIDPLLEAGKSSFNKKQQRAKKHNNEWAGRPNQ